MLTTNAKKSLYLARAGIVSALYVLITFVFYPISYGPIQVRISEALTILPLFFTDSVVGLTIGCFIGNILGGYGVLDVVFGTLATLISAIFTRLIAKRIKNVHLKFIIGGIFPVIINAIIVPFAILAVTEIKSLYFITALQIFLGQLISVYIVGGIYYYAMVKLLLKYSAK